MECFGGPKAKTQLTSCTKGFWLWDLLRHSIHHDTFKGLGSIMVKSQRRIFYTIISIAKSTLYSLYYEHSGRISESRFCKIFSSHLAKVRIILPNSLREGFQTHSRIEFIPTIHKSINFFLTQEKHNIARIKREAHNILCLESYKNQRDKNFKAERDNWILFRGLRSRFRCLSLFKIGIHISLEQSVWADLSWNQFRKRIAAICFGPNHSGKLFGGHFSIFAGFWIKFWFKIGCFTLTFRVTLLKRLNLKTL